MFDFEEEIFHHAPGQIDASVTQQSENDEVAVPAVHFVESPTRDYILVLEVEQAGSDFPGIDLSRCGDDRGQRPHLNLAALLQILHRRGSGKISRQIQDGSLGQLGITHRLAVHHRARQGVPAGRNVGEYGGQAFIGWGILGFSHIAAGARQGEPQAEKNKNPVEPLSGRSRCGGSHESLNWRVSLSKVHHFTMYTAGQIEIFSRPAAVLTWFVPLRHGRDAIQHSAVRRQGYAH